MITDKTRLEKIREIVEDGWKEIEVLHNSTSHSDKGKAHGMWVICELVNNWLPEPNETR